MAKSQSEGTLPSHGATTLPSVEVDSYNLEMEDEEGFVGDRASRGAFRRVLDEVRDTLRKNGADPLGDEDSDQISKKKLDALLSKGDAEQAVADLTDAVVSADPKAVQFVNLAMAQAKAKDEAGARKSLERAKQLKFNTDDLSPVEKTLYQALLKQLNIPAA